MNHVYKSVNHYKEYYNEYKNLDTNMQKWYNI